MASKSIINILFIADPTSIHNVKWMSYFADKTNEYCVYVCCETNETPSSEVIQALKKQHIHFIQSLPPYSIRTPLRNLQAYKTFLKLTRSLSIDCVHVLFATPYALWLRKYKGFSIITTRGSDVLRVLPELRSKYDLKSIYSRYLLRSFTRSFQNAALITSTSNQQVHAISELFQQKSHVIRTGVDVANIQKANPSYPCETGNRFRLFSPRFLHPIYGIKLQLEALELLAPEELTTIHFLGIIGRQPHIGYVEEVKEMLSSLEKKGLKWTLLDHLSHPEMISSIKKADLIVMTPESDGTPNTALEAMAAGIPIIVSDLNYDMELFSNTCWKLKPRSNIELSTLIKKAMNGNYPDAMLQNAMLQVKKHGDRLSEMKRLEQISYKSADFKPYKNT